MLGFEGQKHELSFFSFFSNQSRNIGRLLHESIGRIYTCVSSSSQNLIN